MTIKETTTEKAIKKVSVDPIEKIIESIEEVNKGYSKFKGKTLKTQKEIEELLRNNNLYEDARTLYNENKLQKLKVIQYKLEKRKKELTSNLEKINRIISIDAVMKDTTIITLDLPTYMIDDIMTTPSTGNEFLDTQKKILHNIQKGGANNIDKDKLTEYKEKATTKLDKVGETEIQKLRSLITQVETATTSKPQIQTEEKKKAIKLLQKMISEEKTSTVLSELSKKEQKIYDDHEKFLLENEKDKIIYKKILTKQEKRMLNEETKSNPELNTEIIEEIKLYREILKLKGQKILKVLKILKGLKNIKEDTKTKRDFLRFAILQLLEYKLKNSKKLEKLKKEKYINERIEHLMDRYKSTFTIELIKKHLLLAKRVQELKAKKEGQTQQLTDAETEAEKAGVIIENIPETNISTRTQRKTGIEHNFIKKYDEEGHELTIIDTRGDGHCFFSVIHRTLLSIGVVVPIRILREILANEIDVDMLYNLLTQCYFEKDNNCYYYKYDTESKTDIKTDIKTIKHYKEAVNGIYWANHALIGKIQELLNIRVIIINEQHKVSNIGETNVNKPLFYILAYHAYGNHYMNILNNDKRMLTSDEIPEEIKNIKEFTNTISVLDSPTASTPAQGPHYSSLLTKDEQGNTTVFDQSVMTHVNCEATPTLWERWLNENPELREIMVRSVRDQQQIGTYIFRRLSARIPDVIVKHFGDNDDLMAGLRNIEYDTFLDHAMVAMLRMSNAGSKPSKAINKIDKEGGRKAALDNARKYLKIKKEDAKKTTKKTTNTQKSTGSNGSEPPSVAESVAGQAQTQSDAEAGLTPGTTPGTVAGTDSESQQPVVPQQSRPSAGSDSESSKPAASKSQVSAGSQSELAAAHALVAAGSKSQVSAGSQSELETAHAPGSPRQKSSKPVAGSQSELEKLQQFLTSNNMRMIFKYNT